MNTINIPSSQDRSTSIDRTTVALVTGDGFTNPQMSGQSASERIDAEAPDVQAQYPEAQQYEELARLPDGFFWDNVAGRRVVKPQPAAVKLLAAQAPLLVPQLSNSRFKGDCEERAIAATVAQAITELRSAVACIDERKLRDIDWHVQRFLGNASWDACQGIKLIGDLQSYLGYLKRQGQDPAESERAMNLQGRMEKAFSNAFVLETALFAVYQADAVKVLNYADAAQKVMDFSARSLNEYHSTKTQTEKVVDSTAASDLLQANLNSLLSAVA